MRGNGLGGACIGAPFAKPLARLQQLFWWLASFEFCSRICFACDRAVAASCASSGRMPILRIWRCISAASVGCRRGIGDHAADSRRVFAPGSRVAAAVVVDRVAALAGAKAEWLRLASLPGLYLPMHDPATGTPLFEAASLGFAPVVKPWESVSGTFASQGASGRRILRELEAAYLAELHAWESYDRAACKGGGQRADKFERRASLEALPRVWRARKAKERTNAAVAKAAAHSARHVWLPVARARALVLDGAEGSTSEALAREGFQLERVLSPNIVPSVAATLRRRGLCAPTCRLEDVLGTCLARALQLVYMDHTGSFPSRVSHIRRAFETGAVADGTALAFTFSTRRAPWDPDEPEVASLPAGWSEAHAVFALVQVVLAIAATHNLSVEGADIEGLNDYICRPSSPGGLGASGPPPLTTTATMARDVSDLRAEVRAALESESVAALAEAVLDWADGPADEAPMAEELCLRSKASKLAARVHEALGGGELGAAWRPSSEDGGHRGRPHAVLGPGGTASDADVAGLRSTAAAVARSGSARSSSPSSSSDGGAVEDLVAPSAQDLAPSEAGEVEVEVDVAARVVLRRCMLLYPEEMMFLVVRLRSQATPLQKNLERG